MLNNSAASSRRTSRDNSRVSSRNTSVDVMRNRLENGERQVSITSNRPATTILATDHLLDPNHKRESTKFCGLTLSGNSKTLLVSTILFLSITTGQYFAAIIAHSISLKADCVSMLVDALSYIGNLFAECTPDPNVKKRLELTMSGVSFALLLYFTTTFLLESWENIHHVECLCGDKDPFPSVNNADLCHLDQSVSEECEAEEAVNAWIVLFFALGGLLFDVLSLLAYKYWGDSDATEVKRAAGEEDTEHHHHHHIGDDPLKHRHGNDHEGHNVNMLSALMHVFSDLLRSTTTLIESIVLFQYTQIDSVRVDGYCAFIVCSLIAVGAVWSLLVWIKEVYQYCSREEGKEEEDDLARYRALEGTV